MKVHKVVTTNSYGVIYMVFDNQGNEITSITKFLAFLDAQNYSPNTIKNYAFDLKCYFEYLDATDKQYNKITHNELVEFLNFLKGCRINTVIKQPSSKSLSISTIKRILAAISSFYAWFEFSSYTPNTANPQIIVLDSRAYSSPKGSLSFAMRQSKIQTRYLKIKQPKHLPRPVSDDDFNLLLNSVKTWRDRAILFLGLQGGMRIGEILGLCFEDINFRKKEIVVRFRSNNPNESRVKCMKERIIFIEEPEALSCLNNYILNERPTSYSQHIFLAAKGKSRGEALTYQGIYTVFDYYCNKLGLKQHFTIHALRHKHATKMHENGMSLLSLQKRLGHSSPQTTQIYAHVSDEKLKTEYLNTINNNIII